MSRRVARWLWIARFWLPAMVGIALAAPVRAPAAETPPAAAESIVAGRKAFETRGQFPWYDAEHDTLRRIELPAEPRRGNWDLGRFLLWLGWAALAILLLALAILLINAVRNRTGRLTRRATAEVVGVLDPDRVEALPFMAQRGRADLLGEAQRHYRLGNYSEAIIYLFSYELTQLDRVALIHLAKGKTNRQYLREAARIPQIKRPLELTMTTFEDVFFGRRPLDRTGFEACWNQLAEFETLVLQAAP